MNFPFIVIGAGFSGLTIAERIANKNGDDVLVIDKRPYIGGNCYDCYDDSGILIHKYGPHIFHTSDSDVWNYVSCFTDWELYQHRVLTYVDGTLMPMPICTKTLNMLFGTNFSNAEAAEYLDSLRDSNIKVKTSEDVVLSQAGSEILKKFFLNYTKKQWDMYPSELDKSVISRVPIRRSGDERYFTDTYQGMPKHGYTRLFERMVQNPRISLLLNTDYKRIISELKYDKLICTAPIDEYYDYSIGKLEYRSCDIRFQTLAREEYQPAAVVNYPNDYDFTRITEYKKLTGQKLDTATTISMEYPTWSGEPFYPVPTDVNKTLYEKYQVLSQKENNVFFLGRLGEYRYYNMDAAIKAALSLFERELKNGK